MQLVTIQGRNHSRASSVDGGGTYSDPSQSESHYPGENLGWSVLRNLGEIHIELTSTCNLSCSYCYAEAERPGREFPLFSLELFERVIRILVTHSKKSHLEIIFHGGEPLLQSAAWYDAACRLATETLGAAGKTCAFGMQSNLTLLRDEHIDVFKRHKVRIGTSIDGPQEVHDAVRGRFHATVKNLHRLVEADVFSGAISVIHHHNWERIPEIYATFRDLGIRSFHLNIASAVGLGEGAVPLSEDQIYRVLCDDFDTMRAYDGEVVDTRLLAKLKRHVDNPTTQGFLSKLSCDSPFCHAGINMVVIKHTGEVFPCGCAGSSGNIKNFLLGNVSDEALSIDFYKSQLVQFHAKSDKYETECRSCPARFVCEHGCPAFDINDPVTPEHHCGATKRFQKYLDSHPREVVERVASFVPHSLVDRKPMRLEA
jgi:uncharacterized protein